MSNDYDVVICGSGPAGLAAATWLSRYQVRCKILESRPGPLIAGQADGVQCRTVEVFESFGLAEDLLRQSYHVHEVVFWSHNGEQLQRHRRTADTERGLSHQPHVILNQALVSKLLLQSMNERNGQSVDYGYTVESVHVDSSKAKDPTAHCVSVLAVKDGKQAMFKARYVLGCDGAHSAVRRSLGFKMIGDTSNAVWGVMDVYPRTNFPDIRKKTIIHNKTGTLIIIPREGGSLARFYIELMPGTVAKDVSLPQLYDYAQQMFSPYTMEIAETYWWSAYSIGQRLADHFHQDYRVFLTGDACHTHSPKAGQGMNVSLQDGYNIGWKLGTVIKQGVHPELLKTYVLERYATAADLIDFDRAWTQLFERMHDAKNTISPETFSDQFIKNGRYTAGLTARYEKSLITAPSQLASEVARNLTVGMRFSSAQVIRFCDAKAMQLAKALPADGRWRVIIFAGSLRQPEAAANLSKLAKHLHRFVQTLSIPQRYIDSFIEPIVVLSGPRIAVEQEEIPDYFWPETGPWEMRDLHKVFCDDEGYNTSHGHAYEHYGIDTKRGAVVIVRPDQYVSRIGEVQDLEGISTFFANWAT